jgi:hypothetical protein
MAPEQARGEVERIDARTDLFGLGAVLYELLTGGPPYQSDDREALWRAVYAGDVVPARQRKPKLPTAVDALCMRCLARDPAGRFASAAEVVRAVRRLQRRRRLRRWLLAAAVVLLVIPAVWLGVALRRPAEPPVNTGGQSSAATTLRQDFPLEVELIGSRKDPAGPLYHVKEGELISFRIQAPQNCWVGIWYENEEGKVTQLFPNDEDPDHLIVAGRPRLIPGDKPYGIRAKPSRGPGKFHVLASTESWTPLEGQKLGPYVVFATPQERERLRNFEIETRTRAVSEVVLPVQVDPR